MHVSSILDEDTQARLQSTVAAQTANLHSAQRISSDTSWRMPKKRTVIMSMPPAVGVDVLKTTTIQKRFFFDEASQSPSQKDAKMRSVMITERSYVHCVYTVCMMYD